MPKQLVYFANNVGAVQARLAFSTLEKHTNDTLIFQHGGAIAKRTLESSDRAVVISEGEIDSTIASLQLAQFSVREAITEPQKVVNTDSGVDEHIVVSAESGHGSAHQDTSTTKDKPFIIGITSCPTGIAHTFMAAEGLVAGAQALGHEVKVETQGSVGVENKLNAHDIERADVVIIAADTNVELGRFAGKRVYQTNTKAAINDGAKVIEQALQQASVHGGDNQPSVDKDADYLAQSKNAKAQKNAAAPGVYKHLMTGVSYMLPFVVAGGLLIALGFAFGSWEFGDQGIYIYEDQYAGSIGQVLFNTGKAAFALFVPILAGFIAYSIAGRAAIAPGMVGGFLANTGGSGFIGAIIAGFIAGYLVWALARWIRLPKSMEGLKPILIIPLVAVGIVGLLMFYVIGGPVSAMLASLTAWLNGMSDASAGTLGGVLGAMMAVDMGGPVNKAAYTFATSMIGSDIFKPMAAVMAAGMTPPLAIFVATIVFKHKFSMEEREAGKVAGVMGISFITEGAIPFAARDPIRVIPALIVGSALAGTLSMLFDVMLRAPHGGIFVLFIPNAVTNVGLYVVAIAAGTLVSALLLGVFKKKLPEGREVVDQG